jgi:energy-coupling factor transport system permease protein
MWNNATHSFHIGAWALWLAAAMLIALGTRNPFYLLLTIIVAVLVGRNLSRADERGAGVSLAGLGDQGPPKSPSYSMSDSGRKDQGFSASETQNGAGRDARGLLLRAVVLLAFAVAILKGLSYHIGATVLFTLPESLPVIGGPVTAEGMAAAGLDALAILTVLAVFTAFSAGADYYAMLRSVPPFMHQVALVTSIAITFIPQTITRFAEIREAQALRGHRVRRVGDLVPLVMPLLAGGMERSMNLAEAMESRGFGRAPSTGRRMAPLLVQLGLALALGLVLVGSTSFAFAPTTPWLGWLLVAVGLVLIAATLRAAGTGLKRSRYRRAIWRDRDTPLAIVSAGIIAIVLAIKVIAPSLLSYDPFLRISMPPFDPLVAATIIALLAPAVILTIARSSKAQAPYELADHLAE